MISLSAFYRCSCPGYADTIVFSCGQWLWVRMAYLARRVKLKAVSRLPLKASRRTFGIPDFRYYGLSGGIRELLKRHDKGPLRSWPNRTTQYQFSLFNPWIFWGKVHVNYLLTWCANVGYTSPCKNDPSCRRER